MIPVFHAIRLRLTVLLCLALVTPRLGAQSPAARTEAVFSDEIEVRLVEMEVVVTGADGRPVTGLTRQDFELRQGRKRLEVRHFSAFEDGRRIDDGAETVAGPGAPAPAPALAEPPPTADERLHLVIYLDRAYLEPGETADVKAALRDFLRRQLRPRDRVMLAAANHDLEIVHPFTSVPELIDSTLQRLPTQSPRSRAASELPRILQEIERVVQRGADVPSLSRDEHPIMLKAQIESFAAEVHQELQVTTHQLHRLIPLLAGLPGRKQLVYVGGTLPTNAGRQAFSAWSNAFGPSSVYRRQRTAGGQEDSGFGPLDVTGAQAAASETDSGELFRQVAARANAAGVKLHVLDTGGLRRSDGYISSRGTVLIEQGGGVSFGDRVDAGRRLGNPQILRMMAEDTGGRALIRSRNFTAALDGVASDLRTYYAIAFRPEGGGELHDLRVELKGKRKGPRLELRYRRAYRGRSRDRLAADQAVSALILGEVSNPLDVALAADPARPDAGKKGLARLPLYVIFPLDKVELLAEAGRHRGQVSIYLTSGDLGRGAAQVQKTVVPLDFTAEQLEAARGRNVEYKLELPMAAGSRRVAVAVRDDLRPLTATAVLDLGLGPLPGDSQQLLPTEDDPDENHQQ